MGVPGPKTDRHYTYGDYLTWPDDERWELIEGRAYALAPSPLFIHQSLLMNLIMAIGPFFVGHPCEFLSAPMDVRLPQREESDDTIETVVQPDLLVVCDPAKLDRRGVRGAPDLVVEILSESTVDRDLGDKLRLYEKHGVRCYLIADPWGKTITARYLASEGKFGHTAVFDVGDQMPIRIFEGLVIDLARVFEGI